jgi:valyl-tRNA synthetase
MERLLNKFKNRAFREKAPPEVIAKSEANYGDLREKREKLLMSKKVLETLSGN